MKKPSVTELLRILDKPALLNWANKQGLLGIDISVKRKEWLSRIIEGSIFLFSFQLISNNLHKRLIV